MDLGKINIELSKELHRLESEVERLKSENSKLRNELAVSGNGRIIPIAANRLSDLNSSNKCSVVKTKRAKRLRASEVFSMMEPILKLEKLSRKEIAKKLDITECQVENAVTKFNNSLKVDKVGRKQFYSIVS